MVISFYFSFLCLLLMCGVVWLHFTVKYVHHFRDLEGRWLEYVE